MGGGGVMFLHDQSCIDIHVCLTQGATQVSFKFLI